VAGRCAGRGLAAILAHVVLVDHVGLTDAVAVGSIDRAAQLDDDVRAAGVAPTSRPGELPVDLPVYPKPAR